MAEQRHIIKRQVIELKVQKSVEARLYQDEISRIYRQRILPLIDQRCSELGRPDRLYRIESLDLDLGTLDPDDLEEDFTAKVEAAFCRELAAQIEAQDQAASQRNGGPQAQSQLELFAFFARTGSLPWWAEPSRPGLLGENLEQLLRASPQALGRLLQELVRAAQPRQRIVNHYTDEQLAALCGLLVPIHGQSIQRDFRELFEALQIVLAATDDRSLRSRQSLWNNLLLTTSMGGQEYATLQALYQAVLKRVAADLGRPSGELVLALHQAIQDRSIPVNGHLSEVIAKLADEDLSKSISISETLTGRLAQLQTAGGPLYQAWRELSAILPQLPVWLQAELLALLNKLSEGQPAQVTALHILQALEFGTIRQKTSDQVIADQARLDIEILKVIQAFRAVAGDMSSHQQADSGESPAEKETIDLTFSDTEELLIGNAGLVILWPFLGHFFTRLNLLDKGRRFKDSAVRQRAVGLLQVVAAQDASPAEYLLPLNKALCGLELTAVFDFGAPLLDSEAEECAHLLEAVIAQAPILHDMSVGGFRGTFLLRSGLLSTRDGAWLLRVEKQTYDIVLERFPWSWEWVKLPWMEAPLRVEW